VGVEEAHYASHAGEVIIHNPFEDLREGLEKNNDAEGGGLIIAWLARLVRNDALWPLHRGGMVTVGEKRGEKVEDVVRSHFVDVLPDRIGGFIRTGG